MRKLDWIGYQRLRAGRIHMFCLGCKRKMSNMVRQEYDPPRAELVQSMCPKCGQGGKDAPEYFLDGNGKEIGWDVIEAHIEKVVEARA
jgi:hypothetical protein